MSAVVYQYLTVQEVETIVPASTTSLCLLASYSTDPAVPSNFLKLIHKLSPEFDVMVLLTNERQLNNVESLPPNCKLRCVPNQLLDFGMWARVLHTLEVHNLKRLALVNDSCFIVNDIGRLFSQASTRGYKFWGVTYSLEIAPHLQSYFLVAEHEAIASLLQFFKSVNMSECTQMSKFQIICRFEIGLSVYMAKAFSLDAFYSCRNLEAAANIAHQKRPPNPSFYYWDVMLALGCPLLKKTRSRLNGGDEVIKKYVDAAYIEDVY